MKNLILSSLLVFALPAFSAEVDLSKSTFQWTGTKVTGAHTGKVVLKSATVADKTGEFVMDMSSVTVEDLKGEWATKFITHIKSADFFEIDKHPTAILKISNVEGAKAKGELTIKGKTNPVDVEFVKAGDNYTGTLEFDRTKFGMVYNSGNFFKDLGDKLVHDKVKVAFTVATKAVAVAPAVKK